MRFWCAFVVFAVIGFVLRSTHGLYSHDSLFVLSALIPVLGIASFAHRGSLTKVDRPRLRDSVLSVVIAIEALTLAIKPGLLYADLHSSPNRWLGALLWVTALLLAITAIGLVWLNTLPYLFAIPAVVFLIVARALVIFASPNPHIDVFTIDLAAVDFLNRGIDPYSQVYADIYGGQFTYVPRLSYPPGFLALVYPSIKWLGDPRWASVLCDLATAGGVLVLARKSGSTRRTAALLAMSWLAFPTSLFVIEQAWADALSLPFLVWGVVALHDRRNVLAGALFGMAIMVKQYAIAAPIFAAVALWRNPVKRPTEVFQTSPSNMWAQADSDPPPKTIVLTLLRDRPEVRLLAATGVVCLLILGPFLVWDAPAWFESNVLNFFAFEPRKDALTWFAYLIRSNQDGLALLLSRVALLVALASGAGIVARKTVDSDELPGRIAGATSLFLLIGFLFAKQAFCNYYYFIAGLTLAATAAMARAGRAADEQS